MKRNLIRGTLAVLVLGLLAGLTVIGIACETSGAAATGARLQRMEQSPQWKGEGFGNRNQRVDGSASEMAGEWFFGGSDHRMPESELPVQKRDGQMFNTPPATGLRVTWLGHSTLIVEIDGQRVLIDPVWGERASPFSFVGPKRFYAPPLPFEKLPKIDAIVISHDHYDHLDHFTVLKLKDTGVKWVVPLGVGSHLEYWGVPLENIVELDWWQSTTVGGVELTCTPARHFSGRSVTFDDQDATLWAGWAMKGPAHRVFYSGDTALHDDFIRIGKELGPFDLTLIESGAYNQLWADVHLGPEQAARAHQLVRGRVMLPVHWGLFDLALHGWTEPIERVLAAAQAANIRVVMPKPGGSVEPALAAGKVDRWWPKQPWDNASDSPALSSEVSHLMAPEILLTIDPIDPPMPETP